MEESERNYSRAKCCFFVAVVVTLPPEHFGWPVYLRRFVDYTEFATPTSTC